ncbi:PSD1 and planctomycete cytochrome C domain-containing protein [Blastopirellula marina]|uniref:Chromosome segregation protein n=1 Tax=Blastopirellula marina TaxID=124 RepID=A0A2S8GC88_9BACT|nr:PSD1 and planctomycete cytochrome C domain-containing protein [Blastopirellula marina]PQO41881.1 chromosome segregation protein [Blastopirellula marina]PTL46239.1 DUF1553 domain-containing protein [Blastopirellula marina]
MRRPALLLLLPWIVGTAVICRAAEPIDFNRQIRPILSDRCFHCHGPDDDHREAGFRLDERDSAIAQADSGELPIVPGKSAESELIHRVATTDADLRMPPAGSNKPQLTAEEIDLLRRWIDQGADFQRHWSFVPPTRPEPPQVQQQDWVRNPIDRFVLARIEAHGMTPSAEADKRTLIRRVTLDLTGLPPTLQEVNDFLADDQPDAYERLVDRLLASPRYGERMAWPWLDAARYADTNGYQGDPERTMWPWRDWVVDALNNNMPFDQFTIEQLAGDQIPGATHAQVIASGFNRNHMHNGEGGRISEETRVENVFDRTETTATIWLGLTYTCCRCHTHKFDPISHTEYYALYDFFNQTSEAGGIRGGAIPPFVAYVSPDSQQKLDTYADELAALRKVLQRDDSAADEAQIAWQARVRRESAWTFPAVVEVQTGGQSKLSVLDDGSLRAEGARPDQDVYTIVARTDRLNNKAIRLEALSDTVSSPTGSTGRADNGNAVLSEFEIFVRPESDPTAVFQPVKIVKATAEHAQSGLGVEQAFDGVNGGGGGWAMEGFNRKDSNTAIFYLDQPFGFEGGTEIRFVLRCESRHIAHTLARVRLSVGSGETEGLLPSDVQTALAKPTDQLTPQEKNLLRREFRAKYYPQEGASDANYTAVALKIEKLEAQTKRLRDAADKIKVMVMDTLDKPRETHILEKGLYNKPIGAAIAANVPSVLPPLPEEAKRDRLTLAQWLVSPQHPLTARVTVNRDWQLFFGNGIVQTPEDFGTQGKPPTHPKLLDWLAVEFVESGWDVKAMHRLIVTSATYRQSSHASPEKREADPANQYLARQSRYRLPSWMLRDQALFVGGLASLKMGGPPVKPYQPDGIWAEATFGKKKYQRDNGEALYRRSLYVFWRRIVGPTMFFDVANRQTCSVKTAITNTPLHALTTLNDITYIEAARGLATRVIHASDDPAQRLREVFLLLTSREADERELAILLERYQQLNTAFAQDQESALKLLAIGETPRDESIDVAELATMTALCNTLMNLDEALSRP